MNLTTRQLRSFAVVARVGSFTKAAEQVHMTQAGLSLMIRELEEQLACRLFHRTTRTVTLTPAGQRLLPVVEQALAQLEAAAKEALRITAQGDRSLSIAASPLLCSSIIPKVLGRLKQSHPGVEITVRDVDRAEVQAMVETSQVDLGLGLSLPAVSGVLRRLLCPIGLVLVSKEKPPTARLAWADLSGQRLLALPPENGVQQFVDRKLLQFSVDADMQARFRHLHTLVGMVDAGYGSAVLPSFVADVCRKYRVQMTPMGDDAAMDFHAISRKGVGDAAVVQPFLDALKAELRACEKAPPPRRKRR